MVGGLLIFALAAGPAATSLYWMLGGAWGLLMIRSTTASALSPPWSSLLIAAAVFVVLAQVGF